MTTYNTAIVTVAQSTLIHPDWDLATHLAYLESEAFLNLDEPITRVAWPNGPRTFPLREYVASWVKFPTRCREVAAQIALF